MCDTAVDDNPNPLDLVPDQYKTQEMCDKAFDDYSIVLKFVPDQYNSKEMCDKIISFNVKILLWKPFYVQILSW